MASPNSTFTEMVTTTFRKHHAKVVDNFTNNNALLTLMRKRGNIKSWNGGTEIAIPIEYTANGTYQRYSNYDTLDTAASDVLSAAKYDWAQVAIHVTASGRELRMNNGKEQIIDLVEARIDNAMNTAANEFSVDMYSDGSLSNQIGGLGLLVPIAGTGTVGGIDSSTYTWWRNEIKEMTGTGTYASMKLDMNRLWQATTYGTDTPDLLVSSHDLYAVYEANLQDLQRYNDAGLGAVGFSALKYKSASIIFDSNTNFATTAEKMYFLNTKYLYLVEHPEAKWTQDDRRVPVNQDAEVVPIYWMGQLCCSSRRRQGVMFDAA